MRYSLKESFLIKESKEEQVELNGTELTVYHLTSKNKLNVLTRKYANIEKPHLVGDRTKDTIEKIEYSKHSVRQGKQISDDEIEYQGITSILGDPFTQGTGFMPGGGDMYGAGLYTCYKFNPSIVQVYGDICLKFKFDISNCIILFEDLAKKVHGKNWRIFDQIKNILLNKTSEEYSVDVEEKINSVLKVIKTNKTGRSVRRIRSFHNKSYLNDNDITSGSAFKISKALHALGMTNIVDGLIFRGQRDGPVCVIYNAARDARLVGLGRVSNGEVSWSNSLAEFFNNSKYYDISFEDMQEIARENNIDESDYSIDISSLDKRIKVLESLKDKTLHSSDLDRIYNDYDDLTIKMKVLSHKNASPDLLYNTALNSQIESIIVHALVNENFPYEKVKEDLIAGKDITEYVKGSLFARPKYMDEALARAAYKDEDFMIRSYVVNWKKLPSDILDEMITDTNDYIRGRVAVHKNTSRSTFEKLDANDPNDLIRRIIAEHTLDAEKLSILAKDHDSFIRRIVAKNISCSFETLKSLSSDVSFDVARTAQDTLYKKSSKSDLKNENILRSYIKVIIT